MTDPFQSQNDIVNETPSHDAGSLTMYWLVTSIAVTAAISIAAAHAPARIKLIGLFSVAFGMLVGWSTARLAAQCGARPSLGSLKIFAGILAVTGLIASTWETFRLEAKQLARAGKEGLAIRMLEEIELGRQGSVTATQNPSAIFAFRRYLARRVRQLGEWPSPWPECFWIAELAVAAVASGWISKIS